MKSNKLNLFAISLLLALIFALIFIIPKNSGIYRAVPNQTSLLVELNGAVDAANEQNKTTIPALKALHKNALFDQIWRNLGQFTTLFQKDVPVLKALAKNKILAAFSLQPSDSLQGLYILDIKEEFILDKLLSNNQLSAKFFPYQFHGQTLYTVHIAANNQFVLARQGHFLLISRHSYLVEDALDQMSRPRSWWSNNKYLSDLQSSAPIRIFLRPEKWMVHQGKYLEPEVQNWAESVARNVTWVGLAMEQGKLFSMCEPAAFLSRLSAWNGAKSAEIYSFFPENTAFIALAGFNNRQSFFQQISQPENSDFQYFIQPWINNEMALVVTDPLSKSVTDDRLIALSVCDSSLALKKLHEYGNSRGLLEHEKIGMFDVFGFPNSSFLNALFSNPSYNFQNTYVALLGNYAVIAPSRPVIEQFIERFISNQTLAQNTDFLQLINKFSTKNRALFVLNSAYFQKLWESLSQLNNGNDNKHSATEQFSKLGWLAAEVVPNTGKTMELKIHFQEQTQKPPASNVYWKFLLQAPATSGVFNVPQPEVPGGVALLVQDSKNQLHCISSKGEKFWQKNIGTGIVSAISWIDLFNNNRNCLIFNTNSQLWLLDDQGNEINGFPLQLKSPISTELCIARNEQGIPFAYFLGCSNGNIYGFDLLGRALEGWNPQPVDDVLLGKMIHTQQKKKDYVVVLDKKSRLHVFGKDGKRRFPSIQLEGSFDHGPSFVISKKDALIVCVNSKGLVQAVDFTGKKSTYKLLDTETEKIKKIRFIEKNGKTQCALLQEKAAYLFEFKEGRAQKQLFLPLPFTPEDISPLASSNGIALKSNRKWYFFDSRTGNSLGTPLAGHTPFCEFTISNQQIFAAGNGTSLYAYKNN